MKTINTVLLGLGSNKGNKAVNIALALGKLTTQLGKIQILAPNYTTAAWGKTDQDSFINTCVIIKTIWGPESTFKIIKNIEKQLGRKTTEVWGPREIDIDILLFNNAIYRSKNLTVPHKDMHLRNFVLVPACAIAAGWKHPVYDIKLAALLQQCPDPLAVEPCLD